MTQHLFRKLEARDRLSAEEKAVLDGSVQRVVTFARGHDLVVEGERPQESKLLLEGFTGRYKVLSSGKRQITAVHLPGDFVDLHSFLLKTMDHSIGALSACTVAVVPHERLRDISEKHPHLTRLLWLNTLLDGAIHRQWIVTMGRQPALAATAHFVVEMFLRLRVVGETEGNSFRMPITQADLGDMLGLSNVHVNRTLQELRGEGLITWRSDLVTIENMDRLREIAEFDPTYLGLEQTPR